MAEPAPKAVDLGKLYGIFEKSEYSSLELTETTKRVLISGVVLDVSQSFSGNSILKVGTFGNSHPYGPKPGGFFAEAPTLSASKKSVNSYHEATQVGHSGNSDLFKFSARQEVQAFTLKEDLCVGKAYALANDQYGSGGRTQYYIIAKDRNKMQKGPIMELTSP